MYHKYLNQMFIIIINLIDYEENILFIKNHFYLSCVIKRFKMDFYIKRYGLWSSNI